MGTLGLGRGELRPFCFYAMCGGRNRGSMRLRWERSSVRGWNPQVLVFVVFLGMSAQAGCRGCGSSEVLTYQFPPQTTTTYRISLHQRSEMAAPGGSSTTYKIDLEGLMHLTVGIKGSAAVDGLHIRFSDLDLSTTMGETKMEPPSESDLDTMHFVARLDAGGELSPVKLAYEGQPPGSVKPFVENLRQLIPEILPKLSFQPLRQGMVWERKLFQTADMGDFGVLINRARIQYRYEKKEEIEGREMARISMDFQYKLGSDDPQLLPPLPAQVPPQLAEPTSESSSVDDREDGEPVASAQEADDAEGATGRLATRRMYHKGRGSARGTSWFDIRYHRLHRTEIHSDITASIRVTTGSQSQQVEMHTLSDVAVQVYIPSSASTR